ncbi:MAG: FprA family A-type flavoprotein [Bacteroidales bacterium]
MIAEIVPDIYYVGVNKRTNELFEALWPLPYGVSYNSYLIKDEKVALIDACDLSLTQLYEDQLLKTLDGRKVDYLIINHMEPDHSGAIKALRQLFPEMQIVGNARTFGMLKGFYGITENLHEVADGDILDLGIHKLQFHITPMLHWPETMMSYEFTTRTLFSGDAFGCFGALNGSPLDQNIDTDIYWGEMRRYYAGIVGKYGTPVQTALKKLNGILIDRICSTHGPVWQEHLQKAVAAYDRYSRYEGEDGVVIVYGSMYGNTEQLAEKIAGELSARGVKNIVMHNVSVSDTSYILSDIFRYKGLILGSPVYNNNLFPKIEGLMKDLSSRGIKKRVYGSFGSYVWSQGALNQLNTFGKDMGWKIAETDVRQECTSDERNQQGCELLAESFVELLKEV